VIYSPTRYRYDQDEERNVRVPEIGFEFCAKCGDEKSEDELNDDGLCEACQPEREKETMEVTLMGRKHPNLTFRFGAPSRMEPLLIVEDGLDTLINAFLSEKQLRDLREAIDAKLRQFDAQARAKWPLGVGASDAA
jgi:reverse gyrase